MKSNRTISLTTATADGHARKKQKMRRVLVFPGKDENKTFSIDKDDCLVVTEIVRMAEHRARYIPERYKNTFPFEAESAAETHKNFKERRVHKLNLGGTLLPLLPASIGTLRYLEELDLSKTYLRSLPGEIGNLTGLNTLRLRNISSLRSLPPSIGRLKNLKTLDLSASCICVLPSDIGNLVSLEFLILNCTDISSLPPTIGQLKNLKEFFLKGTTKLTEVPAEIGHLTSLNLLSLSCSGIRELPPSIGQLKNLKDLFLSGWALLGLPEEVGSLTNLSFLSMHCQGITSIPNSFANLKNLRHLAFDGSNVKELHGEGAQDFLLSLVKDLPMLFCLGKYTENGKAKVHHALACNRARFRMGFGTGNEESYLMTSKLWPITLKNALNLFDPCLSPDLDPVYFEYQKKANAKPDAIYHLLLEGREPFLRLLINQCMD